ncbi:hypothetical protein A3862_12800 [Methylobacterium sp. XJLW]|jgi:integrase|uniref:tyrosine-type recombinase/integrase n=2 Tax=Methylobacterium TaxID=407 RepID=UPI0005C23592|nr:tyrosine-type recombinase/integrase [Methylobacterium oryzae]AWV16278.1 hypothetical protein A3862_12800 [Methylobacterium sp. XJLW]
MLPGERTVTVVDRNGMPVWWPNIFHANELRDAGHSYSHQKRTMSAVVTAFNWTFERGIDLEACIAAFEYLSDGDAKSLQRALRRNQGVADDDGGSVMVGPGYWDARCRAVVRYVRWRAGAAMHKLVRTEAEDPPAYLYTMAERQLEKFADGMLSGIPKPDEFETLGLDERQLAILRDAIEPGSTTNPFEKKHQFRNFALILTLYELGTRKGEALGLMKQDLSLHGPEPTIDIHRRQNNPDDPRARPPAAKTRARRLPISLALAHVLDVWLTEHNNDDERYPGAKRHGYVFVSELGRPIAESTVEAMFVTLRTKVEGLPPWTTAHRLRHSFNDRLSEAIDDQPDNVLREGVEQRMRNFLNGWSKTSEQGEHYRQRFIKEKAGSLLLRLQKLSAEGNSRS